MNEGQVLERSTSGCWCLLRLKLEVIEDGTLQNNVRLRPLTSRYIHDIYILNLIYTL